MAIAFDWKKLIGSIAPTLGTALGGPLAGMAIKVIADKVLGNPDLSETEVAAAFQNGQMTGEQIVALRLAEQSFAIRMRELDIDVMRINQTTEVAYLADADSARKRQMMTGDTMPQQIFYILICVYIAEVALFYFGKMPDDEYVRAILTRAFSTVEIGLTGAIAYFIGTSRGSKQSGDTVRALAMEQQKASISAAETSAKQS